MVKITFVVTEIILLGVDIRFLVAKITSVAAEITFKVVVSKGCNHFFSGEDHFCSG